MRRSCAWLNSAVLNTALGSIPTVRLPPERMADHKFSEPSGVVNGCITGRLFQTPRRLTRLRPTSSPALYMYTRMRSSRIWHIGFGCRGVVLVRKTCACVNLAFGTSDWAALIVVPIRSFKSDDKIPQQGCCYPPVLHRSRLFATRHRLGPRTD
jgi:hypothetical protein